MSGSLIPTSVQPESNGDDFDYQEAFDFLFDSIDRTDKIFGFVDSLHSWYKRTGSLTPKQKSALMKILKRLKYFDEDPADYY